MIGMLFQKMIFFSRWLMAPFYLGMIVVLALLLVKFLQELHDLIPTVLYLSSTDLILLALSLLDLTLIASLVLMMTFSGFENFVARIDTGDEHRPRWMGTLDFSGVKLKLIASIVAISGIDLLKGFMNIGSVSHEDLMWKAIVHMVFVVSGLLLALMDYLAEHGKPHG